MSGGRVRLMMAQVDAALEIREVKSPVAIPSVWDWLGPLLVGVVLGGLLGWLAWRWWKGRRGRKEQPVVMVPAHVRARERLEGALALLGQPKLFCISISDTLRQYLEERFELRAPDRTTEEFLSELQGSPKLVARQTEILSDFLVRCDLVKFALYEPGEQELRGLLEAALRLVDETAVERGPEPGAGTGGEVQG